MEDVKDAEAVVTYLIFSGVDKVPARLRVAEEALWITEPKTYSILNFVVGSSGLSSLLLAERGILDHRYEIGE
jgi:hypothetical protein